MLEAVFLITRVQGTLVGREIMGIRIEPPTIGADLLQRRDLADLRTAKIRTADAMALDTIF